MLAFCCIAINRAITKPWTCAGLYPMPFAFSRGFSGHIFLMRRGKSWPPGCPPNLPGLQWIACSTRPSHPITSGIGASWLPVPIGRSMRVDTICACPYTCFSLISSAKPLEENKIKRAPTASCPWKDQAVSEKSRLYDKRTTVSPCPRHPVIMLGRFPCCCGPRLQSEGASWDNRR